MFTEKKYGEQNQDIFLKIMMTLKSWNSTTAKYEVFGIIMQLQITLQF